MAFFSFTTSDVTNVISEKLYPVGKGYFPANVICSEKYRIQSNHDKTKTLISDPYELEILKAFKTVQSEKDSTRIRAEKSRKSAFENGKKLISEVLHLAPYNVTTGDGEIFFTREAIVAKHREIQSLHARNLHQIYTGEELQIEQHYKQIQSEHDVKRLRALREQKKNQNVQHTPTTPEHTIVEQEPVAKLVEDKYYTDTEICRMKAEIQSIHDKDRSLEYTEWERSVIEQYKQIQSTRDSARLKAKRELNTAFLRYETHDLQDYSSESVEADDDVTVWSDIDSDDMCTNEIDVCGDVLRGEFDHECLEHAIVLKLTSEVLKL